MRKQITIRLPEHMVSFLDESVAEGRASSRAVLVIQALNREIRRLAAERDGQFLHETGPANGLDGLVDWAATASLED